MRISWSRVFFVCILLPMVLACQRTKIVPPPASFTVVNALAASDPIIPKFGTDTSGRYYSQNSTYPLITVGYGGAQLYSVVAGKTLLSVVTVTDTSHQLYTGTLEIKSGGIYSFFVSGGGSQADTMLVQDNIPSYNDSSAGLRFVNLSIGGKALVINLAGDSGNYQFPPIGYQGITAFKKYAANMSVGSSYTFEVRDQASGTLVGTYTWPFYLFNNNTVVISGSTDPSSPTPLNIFALNNY